MRKLLGVSLSLFGVLYLIFLLTIYPVVVSGYGSHEQMILNEDNEFTDAIYLNGDVSLKLTSDAPFHLKIDGKEIGEFTTYSSRLKGEHLIEVESERECIVYAELRQHPSLKSYIISLLLIFSGIVVVWKEKRAI
ncbi:hypothetical protein E3E31_04405 [Thermococcus sp. M39]|uniref:hypothetical protein n=1 Tax=unclassified Thermococcus TaxID=2627626 RepID=UPI00143984E2|nr:MULTISPECIES: hypothetical protein [unclassified Thermococcus]NJE07772.1 hypothetical protein [Thermococcus sp. M39]NJE12327.1 hypothetical protein [Thermococcus sp. LS2]